MGHNCLNHWHEQDKKGGAVSLTEGPAASNGTGSDDTIMLLVVSRALATAVSSVIQPCRSRAIILPF